MTTLLLWNGREGRNLSMKLNAAGLPRRWAVDLLLFLSLWEGFGWLVLASGRA
jgi:hypothetical protein